MVITELADHPAVVQSVYLSAFWPEADDSLVSLLGGGPPPDWQDLRDDGSIAVTDDVPRAAQALFGDLEPEAAAAAHGRLVLQGLPSFLAGSTGTPHAHPTTYVHCTRDQAIPLAAQRSMAARAGTTASLESDHCPQLSHPAALTEVLAAALAERTPPKVAPGSA